MFGPARIDYVQCDFAGFAGDWTQVGAHDQRFDFRKTGRDTYEIGIFNDLGVTADCWAIAGGSRDPTADVIRWDCNGNADQRFVVTWTAPFFRLMKPSYCKVLTGTMLLMAMCGFRPQTG